MGYSRLKAAVKDSAKRLLSSAKETWTQSSQGSTSQKISASQCTLDNTKTPVTGEKHISDGATISVVVDSSPPAPIPEVWENAYKIAKNHPELSKKEYEWLEKAQADGYGLLEQQLQDEVEERKWDMDKDGRTVSIRHRVLKILKSIEKASKIVDIGIQHSPEITSLVWAGFRFMLDITLNRMEALDLLEEVMTSITEQMAYAQFYASICADFVSKKLKLDGKETTEAFERVRKDAMPSFYAAVLVFFVKAKAYFQKTSVDPIAGIANHLTPLAVSLRPYVTLIEQSLKKLEGLAQAAGMERQKAFSDDVCDIKRNQEKLLEEQNIVKSLLSYTEEAAFDSYEIDQQKSYCLPDTRVEVLDQIRTWIEGEDERSVFWLNGMAGTGKSTIARTIAREYRGKGNLGGSYFFIRGGKTGSAKGFFATIAVHLTQTSVTLRDHIIQAARNNTGVCSKTLKEQWETLILRPLLEADNGALPSPLLIVIDALDECDGVNDLRTVLRLLLDPKVKAMETTRLRVFITSRKETPIRQEFVRNRSKEILHHDLVLDNIDRTTVDKDITRFFESQFREIREDNIDLPVDWPGNDTISILVKQSEGLFIYAATLCKFVGSNDWPPKVALQTFISSTSPKAQQTYSGPHKDTTKIDEMYTQVLNHAIKGNYNDRNKEALTNGYKTVVGPLAALFEPLSSKALSSLLSIDLESVQHRLGRLRSVFHVPYDDDYDCAIRIIHTSFRDFLLDGERCPESFWMRESQLHGEIANSCVKLMSARLKKDICGLRELGTLSEDIDNDLVKRSVPSELQYACRFWIQHFCKGELQHQDDGPIHVFLKEHLLHWLEALSLIGKISEGILSIISLEQFISADQSPNLHAFIYDAKRFSLYNRYIITKAPLQIYCSALVFAPEQSLVRQRYSGEIPRSIICRMSEIQKNWSSALQTLEGHIGPVRSVVFSPDGKLVASASDDETVRLWSPVTGETVHILEGHSKSVTSVVFSPDGKLLASESEDMTVRLWNPVTGETVHILEGHSESVRRVFFSPDRRFLASASFDRTVRLGDPVTTGRKAVDALEDYIGMIRRKVRQIVFSPDGKVVVSVREDDKARIWDPATGEAVHILEGHSRAVNHIAFSPDGKLVAFASCDRRVGLWNPMTGEAVHILEGHIGPVRSVVFSPDGKLVASASDDEAVRLWNPVTGETVHILEGHSKSVTSVVFSPDGRLVASASEDMTVRLWNPVTGETVHILEGHSKLVTSVVFSPDGKLLASASNDKTVRLWNPVTGETVHIFEDHSRMVNHVVFSPDGKLLASASNDGTVRLWDPVTGEAAHALEDYSGMVRRKVQQIVFSPDGKVVVSVREDDKARIWDPATGKAVHILEGHSGPVYHVAFSPDGKLVASTSCDRRVWLWNPMTGEAVHILEGHSRVMDHVVFSPDGKLVVSTSFDGTARLWNSMTGEVVHILEGHSIIVNLVVFSPNGKLVALCGMMVELWDTATGKIVHTLRGCGAMAINRCVVFSPDGKLIAFAREDKVGIWDPATGETVHILEGHGRAVSHVAFSPDGKLLASTSNEGTVRLWDLETGKPSISYICSELNIIELRFSESSKQLYLGGLLGRRFLVEDFNFDPNYPASISTIPDISFSNYDDTTNWVCFGRKRVLWLPSEYRPARGDDSSHNFLALGCASGLVLFLQITGSSLE